MPDEPRNEAGSGAATAQAAPNGQATATLGHGAGTQHADGTPVRVLVVDDEPSLAELLSSVLRYEGWSVRTAGSGAEAVKSGRDFRPDAVVLDIMLPDFDGVEVMRRLRAELPGVCVLFLTARDAVEDRVAGLTAGRRRLRHQAVQPRGGPRPAARPAAPGEPGPHRERRGRARRGRPDHGRGRARGPPGRRARST